MVPKLSQSQIIPRFWKSGVETKIFLLDPWRTGMFLRWRFSSFCLIGALFRAFFTTKAHQISRYWTFILYLTPRKLQGSSRDPSWAGGPLESWQGEWHDREKFALQKFFRIPQVSIKYILDDIWKLPLKWNGCKFNSRVESADGRSRNQKYKHLWFLQ